MWWRLLGAFVLSSARLLSAEPMDPQPPLQAPPVKEWQLLMVLAGVQFTHILDFMVMMPLGPQFMRIFAITPGQFGLLVSSYTVTAAVAGFLAAFRLDRYDRKHALLMLYGCFAVATALCATVPRYEWLLLARAAAGACGGILNAVIHSIIGDAVPPSRRGRATGTVGMAFSLSAVAGVPLGLFLANHFSWRAPFVAVALISVLIWFHAWRALPPLRAHFAERPSHSALGMLKDVFGDPNHLKAMMLTGSLLLGGFSVIPFLSAYLVANVGLAEADLPYIYFVGGLATLVTSRTIGWLADRFGKRRLFAIVGLLSIAPIIGVTNLFPVPLVGVIALTTLFFILVSGRFVPAMALVNSSVAPGRRGGFMGFNSAVQSACSAIAALLAGHVIQRAPSGALLHYAWVGGFAAAMTVVAVLLSRRIRLIDDR
jgi:predicted MFS family arabinose efflux permease